MNVDGFVNFVGLITGPALKTFRPRVVAAIGCFLSGVGLILSSLSTQLWQIIIAYGLVGTLHTNTIFWLQCFAVHWLMLDFIEGLGLGFINPSSFIAVNSYFSSKRGRAIGLALAGK